MLIFGAQVLPIPMLRARLRRTCRLSSGAESEADAESYLVRGWAACSSDVVRPGISSMDSTTTLRWENLCTTITIIKMADNIARMFDHDTIYTSE